MEKTYATKQGDITHDWYVVDAAGQTLGRLAARVATILSGKHKPIYAPHIDTGDFVIVINASQIAVSGTKLDDKVYYRHSGYPGGLTSITLRQMLDRRPQRAIRLAVKGMLPKNRIGRQMIKKLKVYAGPEHSHAAQQPQPLEL